MVHTEFKGIIIDAKSEPIVCQTLACSIDIFAFLMDEAFLLFRMTSKSGMYYFRTTFLRSRT